MFGVPQGFYQSQKFEKTSLRGEKLIIVRVLNASDLSCCLSGELYHTRHLEFLLNHAFT